MSTPKITRLFSARERSFIALQTAGKPTGVEVEIAGFMFDLVPLTTSQAQIIFEIMDAVPEFTQAAGPDHIAISPTRLVELIAREGKRAMKLVREVLFRSAKANHLIDSDDDGKAAFDEWFADLELRPTLTALLPAVAAANGFGRIMGNADAPPAATADEAAQMTLSTSTT